MGVYVAGLGVGVVAAVVVAEATGAPGGTPAGGGTGGPPTPVAGAVDASPIAKHVVFAEKRWRVKDLKVEEFEGRRWSLVIKV